MVFSYIKRLNEDSSYDLFDINMDKVVKDNFIEVKGHDEQKSLLFIKDFVEILSTYSTLPN